MGEYHNLGKHARRMIVQALYSPQILAMVAAALEARGDDIDEKTEIEIRLDSVRVRVKPKAGEEEPDAPAPD